MGGRIVSATEKVKKECRAPSCAFKNLQVEVERERDTCLGCGGSLKLVSWQDMIDNAFKDVFAGIDDLFKQGR